MKFLKKIFSPQQVANTEILGQHQVGKNKRKKSSKQLNRENLDEVMTFAREQIDLAKTYR